MTTRLLGPLALLALAAFVTPTFATPAKDKWDEEILLQLAELRKSQGDLKREVATLRAELGKARAGAPREVPAIDLRKASVPSFGDEGATVAIVEFSDFQCPYCRQHVQKTLPALREKYLANGKVRYFFVDYPLDFHAHAREAAVAAACANRQGAFWKMHDALFDHQGELGPALYPKLASELGLDAAKFASCRGDEQVKREVSEHIALGDSAGVQGTPAFMIGRLEDGKLIDAQAIGGARPLADFAAALDALIGDTRSAQAD